MNSNSSRTAAPAVAQDSVMHAEECAICPLPHELTDTDMIW